MFDVSYIGAFGAGLLSFLSPCILPIVPFYLSYLAGIGVNQISSGEQITGAVRLRAFIAACCFALGIIVIFVGLGATATSFGQMVREYFDYLRYAAAAIVIVMGLHFLGVLRIGILYRQFRVEAGEATNVSFLGAFIIGMAFAFGWTPCVGPVLATILFVAGGQESVFEGANLLFIYGLGMTLPFVLAALFIGPFMRWMARFRKYLPIVEKIMGVMLIAFGVLIATDSMNYIAQWMLETIPWFQKIG